ncbi:hypothetical protein THAOC_11960, partial [Thalassiosira oceanica]
RARPVRLEALPLLPLAAGAQLGGLIAVPPLLVGAPVFVAHAFLDLDFTRLAEKAALDSADPVVLLIGISGEQETCPGEG